jgi:threonine aldolase
LPDDDGRLHARDVEHALAGAAHHLPEVSALFLENTNMPASGRPANAAEVTEVIDVARTHGIAVHCDGARIWNAAVALGVSPAALVAGCDTVMFCLSKGLGAPVGSVLCGSRAHIEVARTHRARLGGQMRQAGIIAAAGVVALETMVERLADDHARAARLADALADRWPGSVDPATVRTNIVCARLEKLPGDFIARLAALGVRTGTIDPRTVRLVTHKDVDDDDIANVIKAFDQLVAAG